MNGYRARKTLFGPVWFVLLTTGLSGCGVYEALGGMPRERGELPVGIASNSQVFDCAHHTVLTLKEGESSWISRVTRRDDKAGIWETGDFDESNRGGFRLRLRTKPGRLRIDLKGGGAYYHDLGVERGLREFRQQMEQCLAVQRAGIKNGQ